MAYEVKSLCTLVREMEQTEKSGFTLSSKYVENRMREDIDKTEAYYNSKHISGDVDYMGREKPFMNICYPAVNIWFRATDLDRKNIRFIPDSDKLVVPCFLASIMLQEWMNKVNFGQFLNDWGLTLAKHGSAITKFVEKEGELITKVIDWNSIMVDAVDFENNIKVEKFWLTPSQLKSQKIYDQEIVDDLLENLDSRETIQGEKKDNKSNYIQLYEVHGELPLSYLTDKEEDEEIYVQQMHIITFKAKSDKKDQFEEYTLFSGRESKDPYLLTHLIKKEGITYSGGAVKNLFEAQWMVNHSQKQIKDQLDLASKIIFQTSDGSFAGSNVLTNIENGDILNHKINEPLTQLNNQPNIVAMQSNEQDWRGLGNQVNGIAEAMVAQAKSGTAWRQTQAELKEAHSLFELMTENKALSLEQMLRTQIIPFFKKKLKNSNQISAILDERNLKEFDARFVPNEVLRRVNKKKKDTILSGQIYDSSSEAQDIQSASNQVQGELNGSQRFLSPDKEDWAKEFEGVDWDRVIVEITGEAKDLQSALDSLTTVLQTLATNPAIMQDENSKTILNRILTLSGGISPLELSNKTVQPQIPAMVGGQMGTGN